MAVRRLETAVLAARLAKEDERLSLDQAGRIIDQIIDRREAARGEAPTLTQLVEAKAFGPGFEELAPVAHLVDVSEAGDDAAVAVGPEPIELLKARTARRRVPAMSTRPWPTGRGRVVEDLRAAIDAELDPLLLLGRVVTEVMALLPASDGAAVELVGPRPGQLSCVCAAGSLAGEFGHRRLGGDLAGRALTSGQPAVRIDPDGNGAVVAVPVLADPATRAVLTVATPAPHGLARSDVEMLGAVGGFVGAALAGVQSLVTATDELLRDERRGEELKLFVTGALGPAVERHVQGVLAAEEIRRVVNDAQLHMHFQPIAELESGLVVGYEALARFDVEPIRSPEAWFSSASDVGLGVDLELAAIEAAIRQLPRIPAGRFLSLNVSPATAETGELLDLCLAEGVDPARLVVEVTEHAPVDDYGRLCASLDALRERGARLAIDDAGAGFASLRHVLRLHPEMIKLDVSLTRNIDTDPVRRALASSLISFAQEVDATIVAEGIETRWEAEALTALGVRYGQGFHLARPGALVDLPLDVPEEPPAAS